MTYRVTAQGTGEVLFEGTCLLGALRAWDRSVENAELCALLLDHVNHGSDSLLRDVYDAGSRVQTDALRELFRTVGHPEFGGAGADGPREEIWFLPDEVPVPPEFRALRG